MKSLTATQQYAKQYYLKNREKIKSAAIKWHKTNYHLVKEAKSAYHKLWVQKNRNKFNASRRKYKKQNPHIGAEYKARKKSAAPKWLTKEQKQEILFFYRLRKELQWLSDPTDKLTVDHIVPLKGKIVCGLHVPWNLQILPLSLNSRKNNNF